MALRELIDTVFKELDEDKDSYLSCKELGEYAKALGFDGTDEEWAEEFVTVASENGWDETKGPNMEQFAKAVQDEECGCYAGQAELEEFMRSRGEEEKGEKAEPSTQEATAEKQLQPPGTSTKTNEDTSTRAGLLKELFNRLDPDADGCLNAKKVLVVVRLMEVFDGEEEEWNAEFENMASDMGFDPKKGMREADLFNVLVDKEFVMYLEDDQIQPLLDQLKAPPQPAASGAAAGEAPKIESQAVPKVEPTSGRVGQIEELFSLFDKDKDEMLNEKEMLAFSRILGFPGSEAEWKSEFETLLSEYKLTTQGVDKVSFLKMANNEDSDCYIDDILLKSSLEEQRAEAQAAAQGLPSKTLVSAAFEALANKKRGAVGQPDLFHFMSLTGYKGSDDDFYYGYRELCSKGGFSLDQGLSQDQFIGSVMDKGSLLFCSDEQLKKAIEQLGKAPISLTNRTPLLHKVFEMCDADETESLASEQFYRLAKKIGFPGTMEDWEEEFEALCEDFSVDPKKFFPFKAFRQVLDDTDGDYYTDEEQLAEIEQTMASELRSERAVNSKFENQKSRSHRYGGRQLSRSQNEVSPQDAAATTIQSGIRGKLGRDKAAAKQAGATYAVCGCGLGFEDNAKVCRQCGKKRPRQEIVVHIPARAILCKEIFKLLDSKANKRLKARELLKFARHCNFQGTVEEWDVEFGHLCGDYALNAEQGVDIKEFQKLVSDSGGLMYCSDEELSLVLRGLVQTIGHGPMIDHMNALLPDVIDHMDTRTEGHEYRTASFSSMSQSLEESKIPGKNSDITVESAQLPLKSLQDKHSDADSLTADQVAAEMLNVTRNLRQYATEHSKVLDEDRSDESEESEDEEVQADHEFLKDCECGYKFQDGQRFCRRCGKERQQVETCPHCNVVIDHSEKNCKKCGEEIPREDKELDLCGECSHPFKDSKARFCVKCQAPRPISKNQCECGAFFQSDTQSACHSCGLPRFDAEKEEEALHQQLEQFELRKAEKREKSRVSLVMIDNERQELADKKQKEKSVEKKKEVEKASKLTPTALMRAIVEQDEQVALTVLQHPTFCFTEAHTRDARGCSILHAAAERGLTEICRALLMLPTFKDAHMKDQEGWTALHRAAKNGHTKCCKCLASHPALNNQRAAKGRDDFTALHCAAMHGFAAAVKVLLDHPKFNEANSVDRWGRTALHCAAEYGHTETVRVIVEHSTFKAHNAKTKWGVTAHDVANDSIKEAIRSAKGQAAKAMEDEKQERNSITMFGGFS